MQMNSLQHRLPRFHGPRRAHVIALVTIVALALGAAPLAAQGTRAKGAKGKAAPVSTSPSLVGTWSGTATVPLKDSSIVVPVVYTFSQAGAEIGGVAMVPGQGTGPISGVVRSGSQVSFRVTAPEGRVLEHEGVLGADGAIDGMVRLDAKPVAKFRITPKKGDAQAR
jgi:hypothetical protein